VRFIKGIFYLEREDEVTSFANEGILPNMHTICHDVGSQEVLIFSQNLSLIPSMAHPMRHWELDEQGQPTHQIIDKRCSAEFITPIPKPKKRKTSDKQESIIFDEGKGLSTQEQQYDITAIINGVRDQVEAWRR